MPEPTEVVDYATQLATESLEALRRFVDDSSVVNDALGILVVQEEQSAATRVATTLLVHVGQDRLRGAEPDLVQEGWAAIERDDLRAAELAADSLLEQAGAMSEDDSDHDNALHDGHIIRGHVRLRLGDVVGAEAALRAAGRVRGSPQLDSFGPDLSLAWGLLKLSRDEAVLDYLHSIVRFWSPDEGRR